MVGCSFTNQVVAVAQTSDIVPVSSKEFLDFQLTRAEIHPKKRMQHDNI